MAKVSVIVPIYQVENYLERCIDSIIGQTFEDFELILVDDGSPDNCGAICDRYAQKDSRIKVLHLKNGGVSRARNAGLDMAGGKYIAFCDSDDYWAADYLEVLVKAMEDEAADMVVSAFCSVDDTGGERKHRNFVDYTVNVDSDSARFNYLITDVLSGKLGWEIWTRLFKNEIIRNHQIRFCTSCQNYAEDMGFVIEYCLHARSFCHKSYYGYYYYLRSNSMMDTSRNTIKLNAVNEVSKYVAKSFESSICDKKIRSYFPILHFYIVRPEIQKIVNSHHYANIRAYVQRLDYQEWFVQQARAMRKCRSRLTKMYGKAAAKMVCVLCAYFVHQSWWKHRIMSYIPRRMYRKSLKNNTASLLKGEK